MTQKNSIPNWVDLGIGLSTADKMSIFEDYYANGVLLESDEHTTAYFNSLKTYSITPEQRNTYIVVPLMLIQNTVRLLNADLLKLKFVRYLGNDMLFTSTDGQPLKFPSDFTGNQGVAYTFLFDNTDSYNKFRSALAMKFNVALPNTTDLDESEIGLSRIKSLTGFLLR